MGGGDAGMPWADQLARVKIEPNGFWAWAVALGIFAASLALHVLVCWYLTTVEFITFWPAIILATFICGWRQGVAVLLLSTVSGWYFFLEPRNSFAIDDKATLGAIIGFSMLGGFTVTLVAALRETLNRLEAAKAMQETLFAELQHRVANNLQLAVALLRVARHNLRDPAAAVETLNTAEGRIMAMAKMHRHLIDGSAYENGLEPVLKELIGDAFRDLDVTVRLEVNGSCELTLDQMAALSLLVNEAALNAAKHVFCKGLGSRFEVCLSEGGPGRLHLSITDDGPGVSPEAEAASFGLGIMKAFAAQLGRSLAVGRNGGACLALDFDCARRRL